MTASDGGTHTATTAEDGSFTIDIHHGAFTWKMSKKGYKAVSGTSSVDAMGEVEPDLSEHRLVKEEESPGFGPVVALAVMVLVGLVRVRWRR